MAAIIERASILIVEDEGITALDLTQRLIEMGCRPVGQAASGEAAVEKAIALRPDLVLMDIHLNGKIDGVEAAGRIREQRATAVIFLTAYGEVSAFGEVRGRGAVGYLVKPFEEYELAQQIESALNQSVEL